MALRVNIKRKDARFNGDQPRFYAVVSGPTETMGSRLRRFLELQGLSPLSEEDGVSIWSSPPAIGGPPVYLVPLLQHRFGVGATRDARAMAERAFAARPKEDGLETFLGDRHGLSAGNQALTVGAAREDFVANCDSDHEARARALEVAGWIPIETPSDALAERLGTRPYRTRDPFVAGNLEGFMTEKARLLLKEKTNLAAANIKLSKAQEAPADFDVPVPEDIDYLPFQKLGIQQIARSGKSGIIADDMGLGKTVQGIGLMNAKPDAENVLMISQANMKIKWTREIDKWMVNRDLSVGYAEGSKFPDTNVVVINYDILQKNLERLHERNWDLILTDEAHNLKNEEAQRTKAVLGDLLDLEAARMIPMSEGGQLVHLTGTPKPNRVSELWPLLTSSRPDLWGRGPKAREIFLNRYQPPMLIKKKMRRGNREVEMIIRMAGKPLRETDLQLRLRGSGSFVWRLKRDTDLPPKFWTPLEIPARLSKEDKAFLREAEADLEALGSQVSRTEMRVGESAQAGAVIDAISRIAPDTPSFNELARVRRNLGVVKSSFCAKFILDELEDEKDMAPENRTKTVVFAHHKEVIQKIFTEAETRMPGSFLVYDGSVKPSERQGIIDPFQEDEKVWAIIISLAGATGITLTASARMRVVEPDWTPSNMIQIEDRIWRIGQERNVDIGYLSVAGTLDARIGNALVEKMESDEKAINTIRFKHQAPVPKGAGKPDPAEGQATPETNETDQLGLLF
jgi:SNF2 family DNA or RNA helicase